MKLAAAYCPFTDLGEYAPYVFTGELEIAFPLLSDYGFNGIEISIRKPDDLSVSILEELVSKYGISVSAIATGQNFTRDGLSFVDPNKKNRDLAVERIKELIGFAVDFDAPVIIGGIRGNVAAAQTTDKNLIQERTRSCFEEILEEASLKNTTILYEAVNRYEIASGKSLKETSEIIRSLKCPLLKLLADTYHMNIEEDISLYSALHENADVLGYIHLSDNNRKAAGLGMISFKPVFDALIEMNYDGYICAEVLPLPDPRTVLEMTKSVYHKYTSFLTMLN
ncbi:MAG: sugar phosphate isomerase/epimerase family protein [Bacillota bacterium]|nr:sugar phosphate isomerase/epimerase family protein [Bacillota bacterium]